MCGNIDEVNDYSHITYRQASTACSQAGGCLLACIRLKEPECPASPCCSLSHCIFLRLIFHCPRFARERNWSDPLNRTQDGVNAIRCCKNFTANSIQGNVLDSARPFSLYLCLSAATPWCTNAHLSKATRAFSIFGHASILLTCRPA